MTVVHQNKASLVELCEGAKSLDIEIDPDGLIENRGEVISKKLEIAPHHYLPNLAEATTYSDLSIYVILHP